MEAFAAIFRELYTSFLLRDFAGKIVPGTLLILALTSLFVPLHDVFKAARRPIAIQFLALAAGLAWILMLGLQSAAEATRIWHYYPPVDEAGHPLREMDAQILVERFLRGACQAERQQYERFVVIKEATGNLFVSFVLSAPMCIISLFLFVGSETMRSELVGTTVRLVRSATIVVMGLLIAVSLIAMNHEHVNKQYSFAAASLKNTDRHYCPEDSNKHEDK